MGLRHLADHVPPLAQDVRTDATCATVVVLPAAVVLPIGRCLLGAGQRPHCSLPARWIRGATADRPVAGPVDRLDGCEPRDLLLAPPFQPRPPRAEGVGPGW